jgi:hypothetical protein
MPMIWAVVWAVVWAVICFLTPSLLVGQVHIFQYSGHGDPTDEGALCLRDGEKVRPRAFDNIMPRKSLASRSVRVRP